MRILPPPPLQGSSPTPNGHRSGALRSSTPRAVECEGSAARGAASRGGHRGPVASHVDAPRARHFSAAGPLERLLPDLHCAWLSTGFTHERPQGVVPPSRGSL
eukprot:4444343-Pyramimonas_sp.AAC.1